MWLDCGVGHVQDKRLGPDSSRGLPLDLSILKKPWAKVPSGARAYNIHIYLSTPYINLCQCNEPWEVVEAIKI